MKCSLEKNTTRYLEEAGLANYLAELKELVMEIMVLLNRGEYLDCAGVVEANLKEIAKQVYKTMENDNISFKEATEVIRSNYTEN